MDENMDVELDLLTLLDDDGTEHQFEIADTADFEDSRYMALIPVFEEPADMLEDRGELVILKVCEEDGEEFLESIQDEDEFNRVGDFFMARLENVFDFEE